MATQRKSANGSSKSHPPTAPSKATYDPAPKTTTYEFLGPPGALFVSLTVPLICLLVAHQCSSPRGCPVVQPLSADPTAPPFSDWLKQLAVLGEWRYWTALWDTQAAVAYLAWYSWTVVCWIVLPGKWETGTELRNGEKLWYKHNALATFFATTVAGSSVYYIYGPSPFSFIVEHYTGLVVAATLWSALQAVYCYVSSFGQGKMLALGGNTGNVLYDWFIGRELNPRIGYFDIKAFNEIRPGLILWVLLDVSYCIHRYALSSHVPLSLLLVTLFQTLYVLDCLYFEPAMLTTMDITSDGFGFMLSVGDLLWVPFLYSLQARYLGLVNPVEMPVWAAVAVVALKVGGYWVFRGSNGEKNDFRNGRGKKTLKSMPTKRGTRLIISGWWGLSQHPNYLGDWMMALSWCLPTGFSTPMTYTYFGFFVVLLLHRQRRDEEACLKKYGEDWHKYCELVPWRIVPYIY